MISCNFIVEEDKLLYYLVFNLWFKYRKNFEIFK